MSNSKYYNALKKHFRIFPSLHKCYERVSSGKHSFMDFIPII